MTKCVWAALVATLLCAAGCGGGGGTKPPMVPDQPGDPSVVGDGGALVPGAK